MKQIAETLCGCIYMGICHLVNKRNMNIKQTQSISGITLIALVITVIIMLILARSSYISINSK